MCQCVFRHFLWHQKSNNKETSSVKCKRKHCTMYIDTHTIHRKIHFYGRKHMKSIIFDTKEQHILAEPWNSTNNNIVMEFPTTWNEKLMIAELCISDSDDQLLFIDSVNYLIRKRVCLIDETCKSNGWNSPAKWAPSPEIEKKFLLQLNNSFTSEILSNSHAFGVFFSIEKLKWWNLQLVCSSNFNEVFCPHHACMSTAYCLQFDLRRVELRRKMCGMHGDASAHPFSLSRLNQLFCFILSILCQILPASRIHQCETNFQCEQCLRFYTKQMLLVKIIDQCEQKKCGVSACLCTFFFVPSTSRHKEQTYTTQIPWTYVRKKRIQLICTVVVIFIKKRTSFPHPHFFYYIHIAFVSVVFEQRFFLSFFLSCLLILYIFSDCVRVCDLVLCGMCVCFVHFDSRCYFI